MQKMVFIILLTLFIFGYACKDNNSSASGTIDQNNAGVNAQTVDNPASPEEGSTTLYAWVDKLRLREAPSSSSAVITELAEGAALNFLNEKSDFTQKVNLRGTLYDEPWLKVETKKGEVGWIYGGGVRPYKSTVDAAPSPFDACFRLLRDGQAEKYAECVQRMEEKQLKKDLRYVEKTADGYRFRLLGGDELELHADPAGDGDGTALADYEYRYYIPKMGYFVAEAFYQEDGEYLLINDKSGKKIKIWGYPKPSPDFRHMIVTSAGSEAGYLTSGVQMMGFTQNGLEVIWERKMTDYGAMLPKWVDEKTVQLTLIPISGKGEKTPRLVEVKMDDQGNWMMK